MLDSLTSVKGQYKAMEQAFVDISKELKIESLKIAEYLKTLPKSQEVVDLQAEMDCLLKENAKL